MRELLTFAAQVSVGAPLVRHLVLCGFGGNQVRDPDRLAEELPDLLLDQLIRPGHALMLPQVLDPGLAR
jgi:hypothetical protein